MKRLLIISFVFWVLDTPCISQTTFSISTDFGYQRSLKKEQRYGAVGHTAQAHFHFTGKEGVYVWISYYSTGKFSNKLRATAKQPFTNPQEIDYINNAQMRFKQISLGYTYYFKGASNSEENWSLYSYAGFGLLLGKVENFQSVPVDPSLYNLPVARGVANFKRLTLDLGLGWESNLGGAIYFYNEARLWVPTTDYPSKFLFVNRKAPLVAMINVGLRILFD